MSVYGLSPWKKSAAEGPAFLSLSSPVQVLIKKRSKKKEEKMLRKVWGDAKAFFFFFNLIFCTIKQVLVVLPWWIKR